MRQFIGQVAILVREYDEAIDFLRQPARLCSGRRHAGRGSKQALGRGIPAWQQWLAVAARPRRRGGASIAYR